ncbi:hypothetical protein J3459_006435 [Metarhizium acridum]|uniref:uncharacterized protein n=1 Tax=Metarhizium acridum TaxID=92637 RepID=UPI001C6B802E|nr:hypothetical protein J3458_005154 [Metarhizium acridum]KAG8427716.1 hypothetical protein J3459_006435 [Metarhizium acridum]
MLSCLLQLEHSDRGGSGKTIKGPPVFRMSPFPSSSCFILFSYVSQASLVLPCKVSSSPTNSHCFVCLHNPTIKCNITAIHNITPCRNIIVISSFQFLLGTEFLVVTHPQLAASCQY